jgi:hypothetical protein
MVSHTSDSRGSGGPKSSPMACPVQYDSRYCFAPDRQPTLPAGHLPYLRNAGPDDHSDQRPTMERLHQVRLRRGGRVRLCRLLGPRLADRRTEPGDPCFAERRYGGMLDDELLMANPPRFLPGAIEGMKRLAKNGLRYPIPQYGVQADARRSRGQLRRRVAAPAFGAVHLSSAHAPEVNTASNVDKRLFRTAAAPTMIRR